MAKLLIVEDDTDLGLIEMLLAGEYGFETLVAADAAHAMKLLQEQEPDAVLLDLRLPGMDGLELGAWIHRDYPETPIFGISAFPEMRGPARGDDGVYRAVFSKPFEAKEMFGAITAALEEKTGP